MISFFTVLAEINRCGKDGNAGFCMSNRLAGLVVKVSASGVGDPGFESRLFREFSGSSHTL